MRTYEEQTAVINEKIQQHNKNVAKKRKLISRISTAVVACMIIGIGVSTVALPTLRNYGTTRGGEQTYEGGSQEIDAMYSYHYFYYIDDGNIVSKSIATIFSPSYIFAHWADLNGVVGVTFVDSFLDNLRGGETIIIHAPGCERVIEQRNCTGSVVFTPAGNLNEKDISIITHSDECDIMTCIYGDEMVHCLGDCAIVFVPRPPPYTFTLTLSSDFADYATNEMLVETLERTFRRCFDVSHTEIDKIVINIVE